MNKCLAENVPGGMPDAYADWYKKTETYLITKTRTGFWENELQGIKQS